MEYAKFIELIDERANKGWINNRHSMSLKNINWEYLKLIKAGSERINYHCDFKNGKCFHQHKYANTVPDIKAKMCCCVNCFKVVGHFRYLPQNNEAEMKMLARKFTEPKNSEKLTNSGFWKVNKGCILPRTYRSLTCLSYACNTQMLSKLEQFYIYHILTFYFYNKIQDKLIKFVTKEYNRQSLLINKMSPLQKKLMIGLLWKFVEQEFNEYKKRIKLQRSKRTRKIVNNNGIIKRSKSA